MARSDEFVGLCCTCDSEARYCVLVRKAEIGTPSVYIRRFEVKDYFRVLALT